MSKFFNHTLPKIEEWILSISVILMAVLLIVSVFYRAVLNNSLTFSEEVSTALLIIVSFLGLGYCARKGRHITMSILYDLLKTKQKKLLTIIIALVSAIACAYVTYLSIYYVGGVQNLGRVTAALQVPIYLTYLAVPIGFGLSAIEYTRQFVLNVMDKERLHITSDISIPLDMEIDSDLSSFIDQVEEGQIGEEDGQEDLEQGNEGV